MFDLFLDSDVKELMDKPMKALRTALKRFVNIPASGGILLLVAMVIALVLSNSSLAQLYGGLLDTMAGVKIGALEIEKPLLLWINDGLMAIFFLLIGLEVKREVLEGHLSEPSKIVLPAVAAVGGMAIPALCYVMVNLGDDAAMKGWAIPAATDIAFALGILTLFGKRVPASLKVFLLTLAIIDDLGAIVIIALFYTSNLSVVSLGLAGAAVLGLVLLNMNNVRRLSPYLVVGLLLWVFVLKSGVHATLAGVALAFAIPLKGSPKGRSPLHHLEHTLHPWVTFGIMPVFAFANSGISLAGLSFAALLEPVPLGIVLGLFVGKQIGVFGFSFVCVKLGLAKLPEDLNWKHVYAMSLLTGVGFTMSLFISSLAFDAAAGATMVADRLGILAGSFLSATFGAIALNFALKEPVKETGTANMATAKPVPVM